MRHKPPKFAEHSQQLLQEFGFAEEEIQGLLDSKAVLEQRQQ
jgi:crotonobetainyl-CoA:carnitine CoA-transferase CaiB-like acyl-CoA transferase